MLVHVYQDKHKIASQPCVKVPIGRRGRPVQKLRRMPPRTAHSVTHKGQAAGVGTVSVL